MALLKVLFNHDRKIIAEPNYPLIAPEFFIDLQLFAKAEDEGKTEEATEYKKRKARQDEGKVVKSQDLISALVLLSSFFTIWILSGFIHRSCKDLFKDAYSNIASFSMASVNINEALLFLVISVAKIAGPIFAVALVFAILSHVVQFGFLFAPKLIKFDLKRIMPKMNRIFGPQSKQNLVKGIVKISIIAIVAYAIIAARIKEILATIHMNVQNALSTILSISFLIVIVTGILMLVFSALDYMWQKKEYSEQLKMTRHEIKEELKDTEMDMNVKRRLREKHMEVMRMRAIEEKVPEADVVIRNPDHFAVALKFKKGMEAPIVLARGLNQLALKIIEVAEKNDIYVHEDKELAQLLYQTTNEGETIPEDIDIYRAVANIFTILHKLGKFSF